MNIEIKNSYTYEITRYLPDWVAISVLYTPDGEGLQSISLNLLLGSPATEITTEELETMIAQNAPLARWNRVAESQAATTGFEALVGRAGNIDEFKTIALLDPQSLPPEFAPEIVPDQTEIEAQFATNEQLFSAEQGDQL
ncbi:MAG: hypothetical protein COA62_15610 [Rhodobiaceae bacterium]|nr:MAG: hypothetical protein COA62_15610 [Rhodobiaceae bacterium]